jgi:UDP-glucose 4-epimerase
MNNPPVAATQDLLAALKGKKLLVTGGTGSFGRTLVNLCLEKSEVAEIIVYSRDEQKHVALRREIADSRLRLFPGDVRDPGRLRLAMRGVDLVFNAAAIKHVPITEEHPIEAVQTNVIGAHNVCQAALDAGVQAVVSLSTDKAVEPVNTMGMSKALQERLVASFAGRGMRVSVVRYGNVLASNGSVVPYFLELLKTRRVLPVTDRRMTRFSLTLAQSVDLVLHALGAGDDGEIFVLDLPAFRVWDLAEVLAEMTTRNGQVTGVEEVGIRPGEKLHESLISGEEMRRSSQHGQYWRIRRYASGEERFEPGKQEVPLSSNHARQLTKREIEQLLIDNDLLPAQRDPH